MPSAIHDEVLFHREGPAGTSGDQETPSQATGRAKLTAHQRARAQEVPFHAILLNSAVLLCQEHPNDSQRPVDGAGVTWTPEP
jgi:hypothetical protein